MRVTKELPPVLVVSGSMLIGVGCASALGLTSGQQPEDPDRLGSVEDLRGAAGLGEQTALPGDACPAGPFERRTFGGYAFEVPRGWFVRSDPDRVLFAGSDACSFEVAVKQSPGRFSFDPTRAVETFFSMRPDLREVGRRVDTTVDGVPAKRFLAEGVFAGRLYTADVVAMSRGQEFFWMAFVTSAAAEAARTGIGERLLGAVQLSPALHSAAGRPGVPAPGAPQRSETTDVSSPLRFNGGQFAFDYPRSWKIQVDGADQTNEQFRRVQLLAPSGDVIELRYTQIPANRVVGDMGRQADQLARFAVPGTSYLAGYEEVFPGVAPYGIKDLTWHFKHADAGSLDLITAWMSRGQDFVGFSYRYDNLRLRPARLEDLPSFRLVMASFRFMP